MSHGHFIWNELATNDVEEAKALYAALLGWTYEASTMPGGGTYWVAREGDKMVGGLFDKRQLGLEGVPAHWLGYIGIDDVDQRLREAEAHGATILRPALDVPGIGRFGIIRHESGGIVALMTPVARQE